MQLFFVVAFGFSWACFLAYLLPNWGQASTDGALPFVMVGQFGPTLAALVATAREGGPTAVVRLLRTLLIVRFPVRWWLVAGWGLGAVLVMASALLLLTLAPQRLGSWLSDKWQVVLLPPIALLTALLGAGPLGEELGWRGWLLPRLIARWSPMRSSVVLGLVWTAWHLPLFAIADWRHGLPLWLFALLYPISLIALSLGLFFVWKNTRGSVFAAILAHGALNAATANVLPQDTPPVATYVTAVLAMALWAGIAWWLDDPRQPDDPRPPRT